VVLRGAAEYNPKGSDASTEPATDRDWEILSEDIRVDFSGDKLSLDRLGCWPGTPLYIYLG